MRVFIWIENETVKFIELRDEWTKEDIRRRFAGAMQGDGGTITFAKIMPRNDLPADPRFRLAWELQNNSIVLNVQKARKITRERIVALWNIVAPKLQAKRQLARAMDDNADLNEANAELAQWQSLRQSGALQNANTTDEMWAVYQQAFDLAEPYLERPSE